ncbi:MAG: TIGR03960 family B12-binding radical SAM protein [Candidatus Aminicenantes bacterium]|nr:TIGR03960 family B12-binding radical SAM protein [Candidatus Aminicenantes bacterium]
MKKAADLEKILRCVEKPGRYLGGEWNEIRKDLSQGKAKVALVFPDSYEIGMSYLGQKILYNLLNSHSSILAERVYAPWVDFEQQLRLHHRPLFSLENKIPLYEFDMLGFSLLYELNYSNVLTILDLGQIPLLSSERSLKYPLVIGGGPAAFNPEPIAPLFDMFVVGDGEEAFIEIIEKFMLLRQELSGKKELLEEMSKIKGVYVPSLYEAFRPQESPLLAVRPIDDAPAKIEKRVFNRFIQFPFPENIIVPDIKTVFDRAAVEVARGCPQKCRFCQALSIYFPYRVKNPSVVIQNILNSLQATGYEDASLASLSISDYPYLEEVIDSLMKELAEQKVSLSLSALRPKGLTPEVVKNIIKVRKTGFTLVPEAGTQRLRRVINKNLEEDEIIEAAANAFSQGWKLLKLYFMVGIPTEKDEDLEGIVSLVKEIIRIGSSILRSPPRINLSVSSFIPKPHTPFQWLEMEEEKILLEKHRYLRLALKRHRSISFKDHSLRSSILEAIFSRGDRKLFQLLLKAWENGARFDSWKDRFKFSTWEEAFDSENIDRYPYLSSLSKDVRLPWSHIDCGLKKSHLLQELAKAMKGESTPSCLDNNCGLCQGCEFWPRWEKKFKEKIRIKTKKPPAVGRKTKRIFRYRAYYSKLDRARFLSHLDLSHIIQRALRRANISIAYSKGFHPKMLISYLPALPLGMGGKREIMEFRSEYHYSPGKFICQANNFLPSGLKFLELRKLDKPEPSLNETIEKMVYSLDLKNKDVSESIRKHKHKREKKMSASNNYEMVQELIESFLKQNSEALESYYLDKKQGKLYLSWNFSQVKGVRPQDIIEDIFGIDNPVFFLTREEILFKLTRPRDSSIRVSKNRIQDMERREERRTR